MHATSRQSRRCACVIARAIARTLRGADQRYRLECHVVYVSSRQPPQCTRTIAKTTCETDEAS
eukprot:7172596-Lingulodinium_polyedra.AAC.1